MGKISSKVLAFVDSFGDANHRYRSWEHCYKYFLKREIEIDKACLHLAFYLASWGMYRGSSFLLWKDYLIHKEVVKKIISVRQEFQHIDFLCADDLQLKKIIDLCNWIRQWYTQNIGLINGTNRKIVPSSVLISKILLGTLGCSPAYDRYFIAGISKHGISPRTMTVKGLRALVDFYQDNQFEFAELAKKVRVGKHPYPAMKLIDMYFWQLGSTKK